MWEGEGVSILGDRHSINQLGIASTLVINFFVSLLSEAGATTKDESS